MGIQNRSTVTEIFGSFVLNQTIGFGVGALVGLGARFVPSVVEGVSDGISAIFAAQGRSITRSRARRGVLDLSGLFAASPFDSLAQFRKAIGLPRAGSAADNFTLSRLDIDGNTFFGINAGLPNPNETARTLQQLAKELGHKGPTFQLLRHAEGDALVQAFNKGVGKGKRGTLYVDNTFVCSGCKGGLENMRKLLGLDELIVKTRTGTTLRYPRS